MINPNWRENLNNATLYIGGVKAGEVQSFKVEKEEKEIPTVDLRSKAIIGLTDVEFDAKEFMEQLLKGSNFGFDIAVNKLGNKTKRPAKRQKRLQNKQLEKRVKTREVYKNCTITNYSELDAEMTRDFMKEMENL